MIEQFETTAAWIAADTATEGGVPPSVARSPWRHGLAEALRAAAFRLDPVAA
ncbi:hypothetical protein [Candidatus Nephthysia bennettiae]|uniref:Uncharacterized protein n=1 Tax=Candidatus Nephthysia bennettiae TaxID=3127016 RepID=A0A934KF72_9BACT|nr:hypothetical protein [Candidatus Dormibacteraeota bacterium]MBJ7614817.1 hypothetical protein [Candidatus Dormibacteraeota bacterium]